MEDYNSQFCDILNDINKIINPITVKNDTKKIYTSNEVDDAINSINTCQTDNKLINSIINYINTLPKKSKSSLTTKVTTHLINQASSQTKETENDIYQRLSDLDNKIQSETNSFMSSYSKDVNSINYEQNKQFENIKFNKIYLFLFNLGIIFLILKFSYYKKTN